MFFCSFLQIFAKKHYPRLLGWRSVFEYVVDQINYIRQGHFSVMVNICRFKGLGLRTGLKDEVDNINYICQTDFSVSVGVPEQKVCALNPDLMAV